MPPTLTTLIALLRGINVGRNILKMDRLRDICTSMGAQEVLTYVQSGNIVFKAKGSSEKWGRDLEKKLAGECRLPVSVIVRTAHEFAKVAASNPFLREKGIDTARLAVTFLQHPPTKAALGALKQMDLSNERFHTSGKELYLHCPDGFGNAKLYVLDKVLGQKTTVRNWNTVTKLNEMASQ
jgi:uncharacterized protein (DUF1697 family)